MGSFPSPVDPNQFGTRRPHGKTDSSLELLAGACEFDRRDPLANSECIRARAESLDFSVDVLQGEPFAARGRLRLGELHWA